MPEYTYDPVAGTGVETRGGKAVNVEGESAFVAEKGFGTLEDYQDHQLDQTAKGLSRRAQERAATYRTTDQDIDEGTYNPELVAIEEKLQSVQQKLLRSTNPLEQARLATEAEALATQLVSGRLAAEDPTIDPSELDGNSFEDQIKAELGDRVNEILQHAADVLPAEAVEEFNQEVLNDQDPLIKKAGFKTLEALQKRPECFNTDTESWSPLTSDQVSRISEEFGPQRAEEIKAISYAVASGHATPAQALKLAAKDPGLFNALVQGAARGYYKVMF